MSGILSTGAADTPLPLALDHVVVAAITLDDGERWLSERLHRPLAPGGSHPGFGTHNRLLGLGDACYLELIAPDPAQAGTAPALFGLSDPALAAALAGSPRLLHAVFRVMPPATLATVRTRLGYDPGPAVRMTRGELSWQITVAADERARPPGWLPTLIDWGSTPRPATRLPDSGVRLRRLHFGGPSFMIAAFGGPGRRIDPASRSRTAADADASVELMFEVTPCSTIQATFDVDGRAVILHSELASGRAGQRPDIAA